MAPDVTNLYVCLKVHWNVKIALCLKPGHIDWDGNIELDPQMQVKLSSVKVIISLN